MALPAVCQAGLLLAVLGIACSKMLLFRSLLTVVLLLICRRGGVGLWVVVQPQQSTSSRFSALPFVPACVHMNLSLAGANRPLSAVPVQVSSDQCFFLLFDSDCIAI